MCLAFSLYSFVLCTLDPAQRALSPFPLLSDQLRLLVQLSFSISWAKQCNVACAPYIERLDAHSVAK